MKNILGIVGALCIAFAGLGLAISSSEAGPAVAAPVVPQSIKGLAPIVLRAGHGQHPFRVAPPKGLAPFRAQSATITVNYLAPGTTNALGDTCYAWPAGSQSAFNYAASIWGSLLNSSVPIKIDACWASLDPGVLGHSAADSLYRDFSGAPVANTWYAVALANALSGTDRNGTTAEMHIAYSDNGISWYFGTDGATPMGQYDFVSVVLHEIAHGLGFSGLMRYGTTSCGSATYGCWGAGTGYPSIYDRFTQNSSGQLLISAYTNPSAALGSALTSNNLWFSGTHANAANGGTRVKIYAPSTWQSGSSYAHLDEIFNGTANALMTYSLDDGESVHSPGPVTLGILEDMGWTLAQAAPDVSITKAVVGQNLQPGDPVTFTLAINNGGSAAATNVVVTDTVPAQVLNPTFTSTLRITRTGVLTYVWNVGTLGVGQSGVITIYGRINPSLPSNFSFVNTATISDPQDNTPDNNSSSVTVGGSKVYLPVVMRDWPPIVSHTYYASTDDTNLISNDPNTWYGSYSDFLVGYCTISPYNFGIARSILRFNLASIPTGTYIKSATLQPYLIEYIYQTGQSSNMIVTAYRINQAWPGSPTWNNFANAYAESYGSATIGTSFGRSNIDVTALVQGWVNGTWSNYGIMLRGQEGSYCNLKGFGSANGSSSYWPQLVVSYPDPTVTGAIVTVTIPAEPAGDSAARMLESRGWIDGRLEYRYVK